jgi:hypothetical protein
MPQRRFPPAATLDIVALNRERAGAGESRIWIRVTKARAKKGRERAATLGKNAACAPR